MDYTQEILLNSSINKKSTNENASLNVNLSGNKKLLPEDGITDTLDVYNVYLDERAKSNKFRIVINVNPFCTNVLFNPFTEIVRNEGSKDVECLNYVDGGMTTDDAKSVVKGTFENSTFKWTQREAIRDTQLSNEICGFDYHCGLDIFNNHTLRQRVLTAINYDSTNSRLKIGTYQSGQTKDDTIITVYGNSYSGASVNQRRNLNVYVDDNFNTIDDYMRDKNGVIVSDNVPLIAPRRIIAGMLSSNYKSNNRTYVLPLHVYQNYNTKTFEESIDENIVEDNGWYGFKNEMVLGKKNIENEVLPTTISFKRNFKVDRYDVGCNGGVVNLKSNDMTSTAQADAESIITNRTINNREYGDFIDMYPGRDLYSFTPKYNMHRHRLEKNWNYCLTYPSRSVIKNGLSNFPFFYIDENNNAALKVHMIDEGTVDDYGLNVLTIYSVCQHGLAEGDKINIYRRYKDKDTKKYVVDLSYSSAQVRHVVDKYIFQIKKDTANMSDEWLELEDRGNGVWHHTDGKYYPICESNRCNVDYKAQNIYFRRVVNGVECKYYVRMFSRIPNFKFKDEEINDYTLYDDYFNKKKEEEEGTTLLKKFSNPTDSRSEFESHCSKLGFAETTYGDDVTEILFTDDVDTSYLRDNLDRPVSDIYLTVVKNNKGYKEWYGIHSNIDIDSVNVEYSHCFGKVNGSFLLSWYFREFYLGAPSYSGLRDVRDITANPDETGRSLYTKNLKVNDTERDVDEIEFDNDYEYYGDICSYSPVDCDEQVIQTAMHRFNTVQRELGNLDAQAKTMFNNGTMEVDEIRDDENTLLFERTSVEGQYGDPYKLFEEGGKNKKSASEIGDGDKLLYHTTNEKYNKMLNFSEGYYYQPHYRISVKTVSSTMNYVSGIKYEIFEVLKTDEINKNRVVYELTTTKPNYLSKNEKITMYKRTTNEYFYVTVLNPISFNKFSCVIANEYGNHNIEIDGFTDIENINDYILVKKRNNVPEYAEMIKDGSCRYCWRNVVSNGTEKEANLYPFTNGAFYINRRINFYLRRQDPWKENLALFGVGDMDFVPEGENIRKYPNFNPYYDDDNYEINEIEEC